MSESWQQLREQLDELQTQMVFQEDTLQALDKVVTDQQQRLDRITQVNEHLERQLAELIAWMEEQKGDERPPHY